VKDRSLTQAKRGRSSTSVAIIDFMGDTEELVEELESLGFSEVKVAVNDLHPNLNFLDVEVFWESRPADKRRRVGSGNLEIACAVCAQASVAKRLDPCGHLLGSCCVDTFVGKKCPICRVAAKVAQPVFQP